MTKIGVLAGGEYGLVKTDVNASAEWAKRQQEQLMKEMSTPPTPKLTVTDYLAEIDKALAEAEQRVRRVQALTEALIEVIRQA